MFKLLKDGHCFSPENIGKKDILIVGDKIYKIDDFIHEEWLPNTQVYDCSGKLVCPGFIDQHVHITGGGGEEGPVSRIAELMIGDIISSGVSTLVGVLGVDAITRSIAGLLAKARALQAEGITTFIYTGSYEIPTATLTGKVISDIVLIDKVIGVGEIALADHRSSHPSGQMLKGLASEARIGGLLGGKAGVMHMHVGDGKAGLASLFKLVNESDFPIEMFVPTHLNRNKQLFQQAIEYAKGNGFIDLTAGETSEIGYSIPDALQMLLNQGINIEKITVSSDGNGSIPARNGGNTGVGRVSQLFDDIKECILGKKLSMEQILKTVTSNVAKVLKLYPQKGSLQTGSDADILVLDKNDLGIDKFFIKGEVFVDNRVITRKGRYES